MSETPYQFATRKLNELEELGQAEMVEGYRSKLDSILDLEDRQEYMRRAHELGTELRELVNELRKTNQKLRDMAYAIRGQLRSSYIPQWMKVGFQKELDEHKDDLNAMKSLAERIQEVIDTVVDTAAMMENEHEISELTSIVMAQEACYPHPAAAANNKRLRTGKKSRASRRHPRVKATA